jgi:hypothetical protein
VILCVYPGNSSIFLDGAAAICNNCQHYVKIDTGGGETKESIDRDILAIREAWNTHEYKKNTPAAELRGSRPENGIKKPFPFTIHSRLRGIVASTWKQKPCGLAA